MNIAALSQYNVEKTPLKQLQPLQKHWKTEPSCSLAVNEQKYFRVDLPHLLTGLLGFFHMDHG